MVKGLDTFQKYFADYEEQYVLIGGAACDILFESNEVNFRATRDLDMVLIVEALTPEFGEKFWKFIVDGKYRNKATNGSNEYSVLRVPLIRDRIPSVAQSVPLTY